MADFAPPRAVIFDMDGVLTDSEPLINEAAIAMFGELGLEVTPDDFVPFIGTGEDRYLSGVAEKHGFSMHLASAKKRTYEIYLSLVPHRLRSFTGAVELVQRCRDAGFKIAVASSADRIKVEANLRQIGLPPESWDALISGDDVQDKKPAPDLYLAAARALDLVPADCVVVEDAPNGIQAARAAGIRCIAVAQTFRAGELASADLVRPTVADITVEDLRGATQLTSTPPPTSRDLPASPTFTTPRRVMVRPWGFWATLGLGMLIGGSILLIQLAVGISLGIAAGITDDTGWIDPNNLDTNGFAWALITLVTTPVAVGLVVLCAWLKPGVSVREYLALRPVSRRRLLRWCLVLLAFALLVDLTTLLLQKPIVPEVMVEAYRTAGWPPLLWIAVVLGAPIGEELFFRGFLFRGWMHSPLGAWGTVVTTSVIWAFIHQQYDLHGIMIIFAAGLLLGYSRLRSGSIYPPIVMHALMNILAMTQTAVLVHYFD
jgi:beta-phosphoglucomutase